MSIAISIDRLILKANLLFPKFHSGKTKGTDTMEVLNIANNVLISLSSEKKIRGLVVKGVFFCAVTYASAYGNTAIFQIAICHYAVESGLMSVSLYYKAH